MVFVGGQPRPIRRILGNAYGSVAGKLGPHLYETDDVYLDNTGDEYYMYDRMHPGMPIAVTITS